MSEASNAVICRATRVFGKTALRKLGLENQRYVNAGTNTTNPPPPKKKKRNFENTYFWTLYARVIDIASFRGSSARLIQIFSVRLICSIQLPVHSATYGNKCAGRNRFGRGVNEHR
jgi:hypothetical protein